jgi:NAD(P)-dependent dehydrogenase (short-subunit alcohol dehydrogenase family)
VSVQPEVGRRSKFDLTGKVAIVTGGGRGIGRAIVDALAGAGADVAVSGRQQGPLDEAVQAAEAKGRRAKAYSMDLRSLDEIRSLVRGVVEDFGDLHILVNNAGVQLLAPAEELSEEDWDETIDVNLKAPFFCAQEAARHFISRGGGKIVNITSIWAEVGFPLFSAYCAAKGGLLLVTRALTSEWAQYGINVNAVGPTLCITDMTRSLAEDKEFSSDYMHKLAPGRFGKPEEVADAVVFLSSPASDFVFGQQLMVDGGYTAIGHLPTPELAANKVRS